MRPKPAGYVLIGVGIGILITLFWIAESTKTPPKQRCEPEVLNYSLVNAYDDVYYVTRDYRDKKCKIYKQIYEGPNWGRSSTQKWKIRTWDFSREKEVKWFKATNFEKGWKLKVP